MQLGFVGLGRMGGNMVHRLARGGHDVVAFNRSPGPVQEAVSHAVSKTTVRYDPPAPVSTYTVMGTAACCYGVRG